MTQVGVRELKRDLSGYLKRAAAGERIQVTVRGKPTVELTAIALDAPPVDPGQAVIDRLVAEGRATLPRRPKGRVVVEDLGLTYSPTQRILDERAEEDVRFGIVPPEETA